MNEMKFYMETKLSKNVNETKFEIKLTRKRSNQLILDFNFQLFKLPTVEHDKGLTIKVLY